jgi:hypothetical protein
MKNNINIQNATMRLIPATEKGHRENDKKFSVCKKMC